MLNIFEEQKDELRLRPELIGLPAINQFSAHNSSPRGVMFMSQLAQSLTLVHPEERISLSGIEVELTKTVDNKLLMSDSLILAVVPRYRSLDNSGINNIVEYFVLFLNVESNELDYVNVPKFNLNHQHFGFEYEATQSFNGIEIGEELPAGTVLTQPKTVGANGSYMFGTNLNVAFASFKEGAEDPIRISRSAAEKLKFKMWETRILSFSGNNIPLNLYGDVDTYKVIPDIGEHVSDENIVFAVREFSKEQLDLLTPSLLSKESLMEADVLFDNCTYARGSSGVVVDVKVHRNTTTSKQSFYDHAVSQLNVYHQSLMRFYDEFKNAYEAARNSYRQARIAPNLHRQIVDIYALSDDKLKKVYRKDPIEDYRCEVTIEYELTPTLGYKLTTMHGSKGIISIEDKDEDMPLDADGNRADVLLDLRSITARMNLGNLYEQYMNAAARRVQFLMLLKTQEWYPGIARDVVMDTVTKKQVNELFKMLKEFIDLFGNEYGKQLNRVNDNDARRAVIKEAIEDEVRYFLTIDNPVDNVEITQRIIRSPFAPRNDIVKLPKVDGITIRPMMIGPMYILLLDKISDMWLSSASARLNHFGVPVGTSKVSKHRHPYSYNPTKVLSETETRVIAAYAGPETIAEMKDRALNHNTHKRIYRNILNAPKPTDIEDVAERNRFGYEDDHVITLLHSIMKTFGMDFTYVKEQ